MAEPGGSPLLPGTARALAHRVATAQHDGRAPSVVAGVVRDGSLAWSAGAGAVGSGGPTDTGYRIGSVTKTFTAVLVMQLRDEGRLALDDPIGAHLPEVGGSATLLQLLSHHAGLTSELPGPWWERVEGTDFAGVARAMTGEPARLAAGSRLHYSNVGFALLGEVVARLRDGSWAEVLQSQLLEPLGLSRTTTGPVAPYAEGWATHPHADVLLPEPLTNTGAMAPAGQLWSTLTDLGRWLRFLGGDTAGLLSPDTVAEMSRPASVDDGSTWSTGFGLGLQLHRSDGQSLVGHGGSMPGFVASIVTDPASGDGAVVLANATSGVAVGRTATDLLRLLSEREPPLPRPWRPVDVAAELLELTGTWYWGTSPSVLSVVGREGLRLDAPGGGRSSEFRPAGPDVWVGLDSYFAGEWLRVVRDAEGRPRHLDVATFVHTRQPYEAGAAIPGDVDPAGWRAPGQG